MAFENTYIYRDNKLHNFFHKKTLWTRARKFTPVNYWMRLRDFKLNEAQVLEILVSFGFCVVSMNVFVVMPCVARAEKNERMKKTIKDSES